MREPNLDDGACMTLGLLAFDSATGGSTLLSRRISPRTLSAILVVLILVSGILLAWRWAVAQALPPGTYYEYRIQQWERLSFERPDDPLVWATLGGLYDSAGAQTKADRAYEKALELDPSNAAALMRIAEREQAEGDFDRARERLELAAESLPQGGAYLVYYRLGLLEEEAGRDCEAITAYEKSVEESRSYWNAHFRLAVLHERAGELDKAREAASIAAAFAPEEPEVLEVLERLGGTVPELQMPIDMIGADDD